MMQQGTLVEITRKTHAGTETILGHVTMGEIVSTGEMTHITVKGTLQHTRVGKMLIPEEQEVTLEMIPVAQTPWTTVTKIK